MNGLAYQVKLLQDALGQLDVHALQLLDGDSETTVSELQRTLAYTTARVQRVVTLQRQSAKAYASGGSKSSMLYHKKDEAKDDGDEVNENKQAHNDDDDDNNSNEDEKNNVQRARLKKETQTGNETLASVAARFDLTLATLRQDNPHVRHLAASEVLPANTILKLRPAGQRHTPGAATPMSPPAERVRGPTRHLSDLLTPPPPPQRIDEARRRETKTNKSKKDAEEEGVHAANEVAAANAPSPLAHTHTTPATATTTTQGVNYPYSTVHTSYRTPATLADITGNNTNVSSTYSSAQNTTTASEESTPPRQTSLEDRNSPIALSDLRGSMDGASTPPPSCAPAPIIPRYQLEMQGNNNNHNNTNNNNNNNANTTALVNSTAGHAVLTLPPSVQGIPPTTAEAGKSKSRTGEATQPVMVLLQAVETASKETYSDNNTASNEREGNDEESNKKTHSSRVGEEGGNGVAASRSSEGAISLQLLRAPSLQGEVADLAATSPLRASSSSSASSHSAHRSPIPPTPPPPPPPLSSQTNKDEDIQIQQHERTPSPMQPGRPSASAVTPSSVPRESSNPFTALSSPTVEDRSAQGSLARDTAADVPHKNSKSAKVAAQVQLIKARMKSAGRPSPSPSQQQQQQVAVSNAATALVQNTHDVLQHNNEDDEADEAYSSSSSEGADGDDSLLIHDDEEEEEDDEAIASGHRVQRTLGGHFSSAPPPTIQPRAIALNRVAPPMPSNPVSTAGELGSSSIPGAPHATRSLLNDTSELSLSQQSSSTFASLHSSRLYGAQKAQGSHNTTSTTITHEDEHNSSNTSSSDGMNHELRTHIAAVSVEKPADLAVHECTPAAATSDGGSPDVKRPGNRVRTSPPNGSATLVRSTTRSRSHSSHPSRPREGSTQNRQPEGEEGEEEEEYDTIVSIAATYHVTPEVVLEWNSYLSVYGREEPLPPDLPIVLPQVTP